MEKAVAVLAVLASLVLSASASALVTVGQLAPTTVGLEACDYEDSYDEMQASVASGNGYGVPVAGVLTSWSINAGSNPGQVLGFKVFRPVTGNGYTVVGFDSARQLAAGVLSTFPISIPVLPGDLIGISLPTPHLTTQCDFSTGLEGDLIRYEEGNQPLGGTVNFGSSYTGNRLNISATLLPPPVIASLAPGAGSIKGEKVTIAGADFASVSAVSFGGVPAKSFTVDSEGQITATAPASKKLIKVPVTVTTAAGTATSPTTYAYEGCKVPQLKGKRLKASKKKANNADCKIGKVTKLDGATGKTGEVIKQNPKPGKVLAPDTKIKVTLAP